MGLTIYHFKMVNLIKIPSLNITEFRVIAVSSLHIKSSISDYDFLEYESKRFEIIKENSLSIFWEWNEGELFPYAMVKLSGAKITPRILKDYGIKKIYFFLVKEIIKTNEQ